MNVIRRITSKISDSVSPKLRKVNDKENRYRHLFSFCFHEILAGLSLINMDLFPYMFG